MLTSDYKIYFNVKELHTLQLVYILYGHDYDFESFPSYVGQDYVFLLMGSVEKFEATVVLICGEEICLAFYLPEKSEMFRKI